ncbi:MAG: hypothetical protein GY862_12495 [Gammaproteobacteria bacterium]|nr:hypothetical protein [Gammaproteobacteria bacterium]
MISFKFSDISFSDLKEYIQLTEKEVSTYAWEVSGKAVLTEKEKWLIHEIVGYSRDIPVHLLNEATIWARAVYPLLMIAETPAIRAWSEVPLCGHYKQFSLEGLVDGVLGKSYAGRMDAPYLVVAEAKRGIEAQNPVAQTYAQMLAAARLNWEQNNKLPQEIFGCYTIADAWTFIRAELDEIESDKPVMQVETSREYVEKLEAETIVTILKNIVSHSIGIRNYQ